MDLNGDLKVVRRFYEKLERTNQKKKKQLICQMGRL